MTSWDASWRLEEASLIKGFKIGYRVSATKSEEKSMCAHSECDEYDDCTSYINHNSAKYTETHLRSAH